MNVNVAKSNKSTFLVILDDEALGILQNICKERNIRDIQVINEIVLGGITMQVHLFVCPIKPNNKLMRYRWFHLLNIFKVFRK